MAPYSPAVSKDSFLAPMPNPFEVTKAVDFTDIEIQTTFVDLPGGSASLAATRGPMPRFLVGGKGGGRTHLLRYSSYPLQRIRHSDTLSGIQHDGYVGIYFRCTGLNAGRFAGKNQPSEFWDRAFAYYMDVWLANLAIETMVHIVNETSAWNAAEQLGVVKAVMGLFDDPVVEEVPDEANLQWLSNQLFDLRRDIDRSVNNIALRKQFEVIARTAPGALIFGAARALTAQLPGLETVKVVYLLDEYENLNQRQQTYVNTLIREKELPTNFIVGSRRWGVRTMATLSAGEENRQGSEYDLVVLEDSYRSNSASYGRFCREMVKRRISQAGYTAVDDVRLKDLFAMHSTSQAFLSSAALTIVRDLPSEERPYFGRLRQQLSDAGLSSRQVRAVCGSLSVSSEPLLEKFGIFLLYQAWYRGAQGGYEASAEGVRAAVQALRQGSADRKTTSLFKHWRDDMYAQLRDDFGLPQEYLGIDRFIEMSGYLPRNLLIILKQVARWSEFLGEHAFDGVGSVSVQAQGEGVREASKWFLSDAKALGSLGEESQVAIRRIGSFLRGLRFSDKPVEVSCSAFSTDRQGVSRLALDVLDSCLEHNLILEIDSGTRNRNSGVLHHKYQLNPMLSPSFDLSTARRGVTPLSSSELSAVFDPTEADRSLDSALSRRQRGMNAPFGSRGQGTLL